MLEIPGGSHFEKAGQRRSCKLPDICQVNPKSYQVYQDSSRVGSLLGIPVGSGQGDPGRPVISENLLARPQSTREISNTF